MSNLKNFRMLRNMTQQELANAIGVNVATISKYENGIHRPSQKHLRRLCDVLNISAEDLMDSPIVYTFDSFMPHLKDESKNLYGYMTLNNEYFRAALNLGAGYKCELCNGDAPFLDKENRPYLMAYVIDRCSKEKNRFKNVVALCPNCYYKMLIRNDPSDIELLKNKAQSHNY